jgi:hypothetical protein
VKHNVEHYEEHREEIGKKLRDWKASSSQ